MSKPNVVFAPCSKEQQNFLLSGCDFTFYGGAAGAGKTACLLGAFLKVVHHPQTRGVIFRRTLKQASNTGGLFDAAQRLFKKVDPKVKILSRDMEFKFSSGAQLKLSYLDGPNDKYNWQGTEITWLGMDEIQQLDFESCMYLFGRVRSTTVNYPLQIWATGNPDPDAWIKQLVEPDLGPDGVPITKDHPPIRYFVNTPNGIKIYETRQSAEAVHGSGEESGIMSFMFQPGNIYSNPLLMKADPTYITRLKANTPTEVARLLHGSWTARPDAAGFFKRDWCSMVMTPNYKATRRVRAWDLSATKPSEANPDPDHTAGVLMSRSPDGVFTVEDVVRIQDRPHVVRQLIFDTAKMDGPEVIISIPLDPGATAGAYCRQLARELSELGYTTRLVPPHKAKALRFRPFASVAEARFVCILKDAPWVKDYLNELEAFTGLPSRIHDDQVDATSDAFFVLMKQQDIPSMSLPSLNKSAPFQPSGIASFGLPTVNTNTSFSIPTFNFT